MGLFPWVGGDPATGAGSGDVTGPASSTDNALATFDGTGGKTLQNSVIIGDPSTGALSGVGTLGCGAITSTGILKFSATNTHDIGTSTSADAPRTIYAGTDIIAGGNVEGTLVRASGNSLQMGATAAYTNLTSPDGLFCNTVSTLALVGKRADGAGNVAVALVADVENATINAAHVVASAGWANDSNVYAALWHLRGDGGVVGTGALTTDGHQLVTTDDTYDLGASGATSYRTGYFGTSVVVGGTGGAVVESGVADGAAAIAVTSKSTNALSNATAKLHSWSNAGTEKAYTLHNGLFHSAIGLRVAGDEGTGLASTVQFTNATAAADTGSATTIAVPTSVTAAQAIWLKFYIGTTVSYLAVWQ